MNSSLRNSIIVSAVGLASLLALPDSARAATVYSTGFESPGFASGSQLVGQDGWVVGAPFLSPGAPVISNTQAQAGAQSVRVRGQDMVHADEVGPELDAVGSYRRPVNFDTSAAGSPMVTLTANVRLDGPVVAFDNWTDPSPPLAYAVLVDDVVVAAQGASASRNFTGPATAGPHTLKGRIFDAYNNVTEVIQSFLVNTPQENWRQTYFGSTANSGNAADNFDFDRDGLDNLTEFAFGLIPVQPASAQLPQWQPAGSGFTASFTQPAGVSGVTYGAEWSTALSSEPGDWTSIPDTGTAPQHQFSVPSGGVSRMFLRLKVTSP